ncbi:MAG: hypothetical protein D6734_04070 [Candidatus Schekmanbacteria bacterium]|nr:MAG: hypothetical protein D6734_04070 [Candidatus Schekmanbacteria bacterium]
MIFKRKNMRNATIIGMVLFLLFSIGTVDLFSEEKASTKVPSANKVAAEDLARKNAQIILEAQKKRLSYVYNPEGKRDPFKPPYLEKKKKVVVTEEGTVYLEGIQQYQINSFKLTGIITKKDKSVAMVKAPDGRMYIIEKNSKIGPSGIVKEIRPSEVIIENEITIKQGDESGNIITKKEKKEVILKLKSS